MVICDSECGAHSVVVAGVVQITICQCSHVQEQDADGSSAAARSTADQ
jgi:hypothetical protein